jgi:O-antigen/teichoic acid export membrane protein
MRLAVFTMLMLQVSWAPIIDSITNGKYGTHNTSLIFILSLVTPFLYLNNILWSIDFAKGNLKHIFYVFLITCIVNVVADLILIPPFNGNGAAAGFCIAIITQTILYLRRSSLSGYAFIFRELLIAVVAAALAGWVSVNYINGAIERIPVSAAIYGLLLFITKRITLRRGSLLASLSKI